MRKFFILVLSLICVTCAGCFQIKSDIVIKSDGSIIRYSKFIGNAMVIRQIEEWKDEQEKIHPDVKAQLVVEGDLRGYEFKLEYPDIETFAKSANGLYRANVGKNRGVSQRKGWFFDEYDFDFCFEIPPASLPPEAEFMTQAAFNDVEFDVTIQLPYSAEKNNADKIADDGKFLKWNLAPVLIHGGEKFVQTRFKIWHKDKIALTAVVELLLLAATIFFFIKARSEESESLGKDFRLKRNVFAGLTFALAIISAYMILAPVSFTAADIISAAP